jgi:hypothetical protein
MEMYRDPKGPKARAAWRASGHRRRLKRFGLTQSEYEAMMQGQQGLCAICHMNQATAIDHDHRTGEVRGILCHHCNLLLGHAKDSTLVLENAVRYLEYNSGNTTRD